MTEAPALGPRLTPHTLAQFARRAGITHSYARKLYSAVPSRLPDPDEYDADHRPLWYPDTIDAWAASTGRPADEGALWLLRAPAVSGPAEVRFRGLVDRPVVPGGRPMRLHATVYGTDHGPLVVIMPTDEEPDRWTWVGDYALVAADLVAPRFWSDTIVVVDLGGSLPRPYQRTVQHGPGSGTEIVLGSWSEDYEPILSCFTLRVDPEPAAQDTAGMPVDAIEPTLRDRALRLLGRVQPPEEAAPPPRPQPRAQERRPVTCAQLKRVLGVDLPQWLAGTRLPAVLERARAYHGTLTIPDRITPWPATLDRLQAAHTADMAEHFPAAFALLAADAADMRAAVRRVLDAQPVRGDGWYLAARPANPELPLHLETATAALPSPRDLDPTQIRAELIELRQTEAELPADTKTAPEGPAYEHAVALLAVAAETHHPQLAVDTCVIESGDLAGVAAQQWREGLTPHPAPKDVLRTRRGHRLLNGRPADQVRELLVDYAGRLVCLFDGGPRADVPYWHAEWPVGWPTEWNASTVIAADPDNDEESGGQPVLALTTTADGVRAEPVPLLPDRRDGDTFAFGYDGHGPGVLYDALVRIAVCSHRGFQPAIDPGSGSALWQAITHRGPLRLRWADVQKWAKQDAAHELRH
ncbi:hypothetical protein ETD83_10890 [Actinomadura soli]|uniref:Uncharacterized protein n=1 Tax=Actinomadura soli TaxID=2508997 RepID=A0A5C4JH51_9ACTN|nr:hypothetical protein [Actinomadura soli]TMR03404.1 hypothetical protein ETD83_10890 [Actinomadura soli]